MSITERKIFELERKLHSLKLEFDDWRANSESGGTLEKHHTQIRRITKQLEGLQEELKKDVGRLASDQKDFLSQCGVLEQQMLELHRIWEFFRSKFALRSVNWFSNYLVAADEFAWACYRAPQERVLPEYIHPQEIKEPPLVFFNRYLSPYTLPRKDAFRAEAVPHDDPRDKKRFFDCLSDLPIPLVGIPWFQIQYLPEALVIGHEVGHIVRNDLRLKERTECLLEAGLEKGAVSEYRRGAWRSWIEEVFADVYGNLCTGPAFVDALMDFLATGETEIAQEHLTDPNWGNYPTAYLRVRLSLDVLERQGFEEESSRLKATWERTYSQHAMTEFENDIPFIAEALLEGPYPEFGGLTLTDVLRFTTANHFDAVDDAKRILNDGVLNSTDVRVLYASARWAFAEDPQGYENKDVQRSILNRILEVQGFGVRRNASDREELDDYDLRAGKKLFTKFKMLSSGQ